MLSFTLSTSQHGYAYTHFNNERQQNKKQVFPFVHTFPACDESRRTWIESTCARCPATTQILERLPNIRTALFSRLGGGSRISGHKGWADLANHVLRCHLPLKVPTDGPCGLWVNGEVTSVCVCAPLCLCVYVCVYRWYSIGSIGHGC